MRVRLSAASRCEYLVLYDRAAIPPDTPVDPDLEAQEPVLPPKKAIQKLAADGHALVVRIPGDDCEATFEVFVGEDPTQVITQRGKVLLSGGRLVVPSGTLTADGLEFLSLPGADRTHSIAEAAEIPSGTYAVEVLELLSWKLESSEEYIRAHTRPLDRAVHTLVQSLAWVGILGLWAHILVVPGLLLFLWRSRGWRAAALAAAFIVLLDVVILGTFHVLEWARRWWPALSRVEDLVSTFEKERPDIAVLLRPTAEAETGKPTFTTIRV
jgi:hypothetical protein